MRRVPSLQTLTVHGGLCFADGLPNLVIASCPRLKALMLYHERMNQRDSEPDSVLGVRFIDGPLSNLENLRHLIVDALDLVEFDWNIKSYWDTDPQKCVDMIISHLPPNLEMLFIDEFYVPWPSDEEEYNEGIFRVWEACYRHIFDSGRFPRLHSPDEG